MQKDANTILLFTEHRAAIDYLSDEDAGKLIKALFAYVDEGKLPDFKGPMMSLFTVIRTQIDRSHEAYKAKCEKNRSNSMKRKVMQGNSAVTSMDNDRNPSLSTDNDRCPPTTTDVHRQRPLSILILLPTQILSRIQILMMVLTHTLSMTRRWLWMKNTLLTKSGKCMESLSEI